MAFLTIEVAGTVYILLSFSVKLRKFIQNFQALDMFEKSTKTHVRRVRKDNMIRQRDLLRDQFLTAQVTSTFATADPE